MEKRRCFDVTNLYHIPNSFNIWRIEFFGGAHHTSIPFGDSVLTSFSMQRSPVDDIIDKIVAELLKLNQIDYVSQSALNSMSEIVKSCKGENEV